MTTPVPATCPVPYCPSLPSSDSAYRLLAGGGLPALAEVVGSTLVRGLLISAGIKLFDWNNRQPIQLGVAGAASIEFFVLAYTWLKMPKATG